MRRTILPALLLSLLALPTVLHAQGATLIGTVLCGDTNTPARFARVFLKPASLDPSIRDNYIQQMMDSQRTLQRVYGNTTATPAPPPQETQAQRDEITRNATTRTEQSNSTTVDVTGHYTLPNIAPGTYYVHAQMPGYADPLDSFSLQEQTSTDPDVRARIAARVPIITILGVEQQRIDLRLDRGAAVAGRILFDDGAPAVGWMVTVLPRSELTRKPGDPPPSLTPNSGGIGPSSPLSRTDDLGNYRFTGLAAGDYTVHALLFVQTPGGRGDGLPIHVYNGDAMRLADARFFTLTPGQLRAGTDITVPLRSMHNIRGYVVAKSDGHRVNSGRVLLINATEKTDQGPGATVNSDGSFQFYSVPPGAYKLAIDNASDITIAPANPNTPVPPGSFVTGARTTVQSTHRYESADAFVTLSDGDLDGVTITVPEIEPGSNQ